MGKIEFEKLLSDLAQNDPSITELRLVEWGVSLTPQDTLMLYHALKLNTQVISLNLIAQLSMGPLLPFTTMKGLTNLQIRGCRIKKAAFLDAVPAFANTSLTRLDISGQKISNEGINAILKHIKSLEVLIADNCKTNKKFNLPELKNTNLKTLSLADNEMSDKAVVSILASQKLRALKINGHLLNESFVNALKKNNSLRSLNLMPSKYFGSIESPILNRLEETLVLNNNLEKVLFSWQDQKIGELAQKKLDQNQLSNQNIEACYVFSSLFYDQKTPLPKEMIYLISLFLCCEQQVKKIMPAAKLRNERPTHELVTEGFFGSKSNKRSLVSDTPAPSKRRTVAARI